jgi:Autophagy protein Apg5
MTTLSTATDGGSSTSSTSSSSSNIQALNWAGCIPIVLTLAPSSLSSPTMPPPIHVLVSRQTFLHAGLEDAVRRLHPFAPTAVSFRAGLVRTEPDPGASAASNHNSSNNDADTDKNTQNDAAGGTSNDQGGEGKTTQAAAATDDGSNRNPVQRSSSSSSSDQTPYPICWFEDEDSQTALRWNLFTGVLYDLINVQTRQKDASFSSSSSISSMPSSSLIPWKIRLHFSAPYPTNQILPLDTACPLLMQVWNFYKNSLKQALCLQNGNSKAAMNLSKENHGRLWDAIRLDNFNLYHQVHREQSLLSIMSSSESSASRPNKRRIPTRLLVDGKPPRHASSLYIDALTLGMLLAQQLPSHFIVVQHEPTQQQQQHASPTVAATGATFANSTAKTTTNNVTATTIIAAKDDCVLDWSVAGIVKPPLHIPVATLWENLCHADHFLYIVVHTC